MLEYGTYLKSLNVYLWWIYDAGRYCYNAGTYCTAKVQNLYYKSLVPLLAWRFWSKITFLHFLFFQTLEMCLEMDKSQKVHQQLHQNQWD